MLNIWDENKTIRGIFIAINAFVINNNLIEKNELCIYIKEGKTKVHLK